MEYGSLVLAAYRRLLKPLVRILLRSGVSWREFSESAKRVFVEVAREDYGIKGRPTNLTRVALMTGLSRREVGVIRRELEARTPVPVNPGSRISRVLTGWHRDPDFLDKKGRPLELTPDGEIPSFRALLKRYAGDIPASAITKEMKSVKVMEQAPSGKLKVSSRHYVRSRLEPDIVRQTGVALHDHAHTLAHNLDSDSKSVQRFERIASNDYMPASAGPKLAELVEKHGQGLLEQIDKWLSDNEARSDESDASGGDTYRMGVGVYLFEYPKKEDA